MTIYQRVTGSEWSALYVDGAVEAYGEHYVVDDRIAAIFGIQDIVDVQVSDWYMERKEGNKSIGAVQPTVELIMRKRYQRIRVYNLASDLRDEAAALVARAEELEAQK